MGLPDRRLARPLFAVADVDPNRPLVRVHTRQEVTPASHLDADEVAAPIHEDDHVAQVVVSAPEQDARRCVGDGAVERRPGALTVAHPGADPRLVDHDLVPDLDRDPVLSVARHKDTRPDICTHFTTASARKQVGRVKQTGHADALVPRLPMRLMPPAA